MSLFKFTCLYCGQKILGDSDFVGRGIPCPTCQKSLTVPPPGSADIPFIRSSVSTTVPLPGCAAGYPEEQAATEKNSRLALAALILSPTILPAIVCGHLALSRIRRQHTLKGAEIAMAGLGLGYFLLAFGLTLLLVNTFL